MAFNNQVFSSYMYLLDEATSKRSHRIDSMGPWLNYVINSLSTLLESRNRYPGKAHFLE